MAGCGDCKFWATDGPYGDDDNRACRYVQRAADAPDGCRVKMVMGGALITHRAHHCAAWRAMGGRGPRVYGSWEYPPLEAEWPALHRLAKHGKRCMKNALCQSLI